jgi:hypothetical protein
VRGRAEPPSLQGRSSRARVLYTRRRPCISRSTSDMPTLGTLRCEARYRIPWIAIHRVALVPRFDGSPRPQHRRDLRTRLAAPRSLDVNDPSPGIPHDPSPNVVLNAFVLHGSRSFGTPKFLRNGKFHDRGSGIAYSARFLIRLSLPSSLFLGSGPKLGSVGQQALYVLVKQPQPLSNKAAAPLSAWL